MTTERDKGLTGTLAEGVKDAAQTAGAVGSTVGSTMATTASNVASTAANAASTAANLVGSAARSAASAVGGAAQRAARAVGLGGAPKTPRKRTARSKKAKAGGSRSRSGK